MEESLTEKWLVIEMWSREFGIPVSTLQDRLQRARAFPGRTPDGRPLLSYAENDVRRLCADLIKPEKE